MLPMLFAITGRTVVLSKSEAQCETAKDCEAHGGAAAVCTVIDSRVHVSRLVVEPRAQDDALRGESSSQLLEGALSYVQIATTPE
jgi:hypothetical protein